MSFTVCSASVRLISSLKVCIPASGRPNTAVGIPSFTQATHSALVPVEVGSIVVVYGISLSYASFITCFVKRLFVAEETDIMGPLSSFDVPSGVPGCFAKFTSQMSAKSGFMV